MFKHQTLDTEEFTRPSRSVSQQGPARSQLNTRRDDGTPWMVQTNRRLTRAEFSREIDGHEVEFTDRQGLKVTHITIKISLDRDILPPGRKAPNLAARQVCSALHS